MCNLYAHLEKHFNKCYNVYMNDLGMLSSYSAYTSAASSLYGLSRISAEKDKQDASAVGNLSSSGDINDEAIISPEATKLLESEQSDNKSDDSKDAGSTSIKSSQSDESLTPQQKQQIAELKARDAEVKSHEQAHRAAAAGISASAPSYEYETGPDGKKYAVGGEVNLSFVQGGDLRSNIANAQAMKAAALAPSQPSGQDMAVARAAERMIAEAKQQLAQQQAEVIGIVNQSANTAEKGLSLASGITEQTSGDVKVASNELPVFKLSADGESSDFPIII